MPKPERPPEESGTERFIANVSRFIVSLMWAALLAVVLFVVYLVERFYG